MRIKRGIASLLVFFSLVSIFQYSIVEATTFIESTDGVSREDDNAIGKKLIIRSIIKNADNEVVVSWDEVEGAEYQVMVNSDIIDLKENYITSKQVSNQEYYYKVRYKLGDEYSLWSDVKAYTYEENNLRMSKAQNASYPYISGSAYGTKGKETKWHDFSSEGGNVYSINLDSAIEIVKFNVNNKVKDLQIQYRAYISQDKAWSDWKNEGEEAGVKGKTISAIAIKYVSSDQSAFIRYSTIDSDNVQSAYYNNEESYGKPEELSAIKGIKVYLDTDYTKLQNDEIWKSGVTKDIKGTYEIPEGRTLTIESGAKINFSNDVGEKSGFVIKGNLIIKGTSTSKVEIKSDNNDMDIDVKYTGDLKADYLKILSKELNDNSIINVYGNIDINNYELSSSNTAAVVSKGIVFD